MVQQRSIAKRSDKLLGHDARPRIDADLHVRNLRVDLLKKGNDKIHKLVLVQLLQVVVRDQKAQGVAVDGLSSQDDKLLRALAQEAREARAQHLLELVRLLDADRDAH